MKRATADEWWRTAPMGDGITLVEEPWILPYYRCNCWHVRGRDRDLMVDTGMGVVGLRAHVPLFEERPVVAVASHTHFDHIGAHWEFGERWVHRAEADLLAAPGREAILADLVTDAIFERLPPEPYRSDDYGVRAAAATRLLEDGDVLDTGDRAFEVIHTPGHSPGGIALWEKATGVLIAGDIVYDGPLSEDCYHSDAADYVRSMERLLDYPARVVHAGHFPSFTGERLRAIIRAWLASKGF